MNPKFKCTCPFGNPDISIDKDCPVHGLSVTEAIEITPTKWVSVEKELPDYDQLVIWYREDGIMFIDEIDHDSDWEYFESIHCSEFPDDNENISITHWMPLPEPPNVLKIANNE